MSIMTMHPTHQQYRHTITGQIYFMRLLGIHVINYAILALSDERRHENDLEDRAYEYGVAVRHKIVFC